MAIHEALLTCPHCERVNEAHAELNGISRPRCGDVAICWSCRQPSIYTHTAAGVLAQRVPTAAERAALMDEPDVRRGLAAMAESYSPMQATALFRGGRSGE